MAHSLGWDQEKLGDGGGSGERPSVARAHVAADVGGGCCFLPPRLHAHRSEA